MNSNEKMGVAKQTTGMSSGDQPNPFLKWAGGKRWLASRYLNDFPEKFDTYIEPFFGSGAMFFALSPEKAIISDTNEDLINCYRRVRDSWSEIENLLKDYQTRHSKEFYYATRSSEPTCPVERAARFVYLNRTCWNGLYRVNKRGMFNVPIGTKTNVDMGDDFSAISEALKKADILHQDFAVSLGQAKMNDLVYVDPPYTVKHNNNGFIKYNESIFSWDDQVRLAESVAVAVSRGAKVIISNADHPSIHDLYEGLGEIRSISRASVISGKASGRGSYGEVLIECS